MVLVGAVGAGEKLQELGDSSALVAADIGLMIVVVLAIHLVLLFGGFCLAKLLRMNRADAIAVGISGSQKTIMVGLYVALAFSPLAILPMVAYHAGQLVVDTLVTDWWRHQASHVRQ